MSTSFEEILNAYDYTISPKLIANTPTTPRDSAKLLVYKRATKEVCFDTFRNVYKYLPKGAMLVLNDTKVLPARLVVRKKKIGDQGGGSVELLYIGTQGKEIIMLSNKKLVLGAELFLTKTLYFTVQAQEGSVYMLSPSFPLKKFQQVLLRYGKTPLPPYIKNSPLSERSLREKYQSVFAKEQGSVAAPTASLHFTKRLLATLKQKGFGMEFVTLHVNRGTFATLTPEVLEKGTLHEEYYSISPRTAEKISKAKKEGRAIIPIGTTALRTLESVVDSKGNLVNLSGSTRLFIQPGYKFKIADGLITNFHVPRSSLMMLVAALVGREKLLELYKEAQKRKLKFFSFGDGMLII